MKKYFSLTVILFLSSILPQKILGQYHLPFGNVTVRDLMENNYKPDPGADAVVLSETGLASLQYQTGFFIELEVNKKIKIINSKGFDYADIEIPYFLDDDMVSYKASTYNLRNGEKVETKVPKESFITEKSNSLFNTLKFSFPDVHEGSVLEYSYKTKLRVNGLFALVPWDFQYEIPVAKSALTVTYPDAFVYKSIINGSSQDVHTDFVNSSSMFFGENVSVTIRTFSVTNMPAFKTEPYILSEDEHLTRVTFELSRVEFPNITYDDISPTYNRLNKKLLDKDDFGTAIATNFKSLASEVTAGASDDLAKLKQIHKYVSDKVFWNGDLDYRASSTLRNVLRKGKGNSADVNMILIAMLKSAGINAEPVILSTRSNGSLNLNSAMLQQFNYVVASVPIGDKTYLVDATDPLRPFDMLPFDCLNGSGRLIRLTESGFVDMKNHESYTTQADAQLKVNPDGSLSGTMEEKNSSYSANSIRQFARLEGIDGYKDFLRSAFPTADLSDITIDGLKDPYSDVIVKYGVRFAGGTELAGDKLLIVVALSSSGYKSPFYSAERKFPVDFGCLKNESTSFRITVPDGYSLMDKPADETYTMPGDGAKYEFACNIEGNDLVLKSSFNLSKTTFQTSEYAALRSFYYKMLQKQTETIVFKKNPVSK
jgi:transglutaminase-like putative cysteine protease